MAIIKKNINRLFLVIEIIFILVPVTALLLFGFFMAITQLGNIEASNTGIVIILTLVSIGSTLSVWWLTISYLKGLPVLSGKVRLLWLPVLVGVLVTLMGLVTLHSPTPAESESAEWMLHYELGMFVFGLPLLLPAIHVFLSALIALIPDSANKPA